MAVVVVAIGMAFGLGACDWAQFRGGADHSGDNPVETAISTSNASTLTQVFSTSLAWPYSQEATVANGAVYVASASLHPNMGSELQVFDATGNTNCSGTPTSCTPLWTAGDPGIDAPPAVANGVVFAASGGQISSEDPDGGLFAYDAAGKTDCSGIPAVCQPMWTYDTGSEPVNGSPTVSDGMVYAVNGAGELEAFDDAGATNCSGSPKVCEPLWTADLGGSGASPAQGNSMVYVTVGNTVVAFDAAGNRDCSGTPKVCNPIWSGEMAESSSSSPSVINGVVYVGASDKKLYAFDASGNTNCNGSPVLCQPLWTASTGSSISSTPAVASGVVYVGSDKLYAFDAAGRTNCSGTPMVCTPLWTASTGSGPTASPTIANGVVYEMSNNGLYAFDAAGKIDCTGAPITCAPLWSVSQEFYPGAGGPSIANGVLYANTFNTAGGGFGGEVAAYALPKQS